MAMEVDHGDHQAKDYEDPPPALFLDRKELRLWSFYRAIIAEFVATLLFLYITISTVIGNQKNIANCQGVGPLGIAWAFGGMIFVLVYCTAGISGGHINPAVTFALFLARKVSLPRAIMYILAQCVGAMCGVALVDWFQKASYVSGGGGVNTVQKGYSKTAALATEILGTFVLVYTVFSATDPKRKARDSHVPVLAPLPIGFAVFMVHLATIPITGTGINPARSFGPAIVYGRKQPLKDQWIFWLGPLVGATAAAAYHQYVLRAAGIKALRSFRSQSNTTQ
ncbi:hypothetical protein KI387_032575 [Taxus chinensis]|uniref:Uncharacterized protein n=1 Tax=Taxus chinensis TaxID=29808 RepID=A0AA38F3Q1_TAXCH|nr:hypothetical protein KI387_032575 [Taxus chinensis]